MKQANNYMLDFETLNRVELRGLRGVHHRDAENTEGAQRVESGNDGATFIAAFKKLYLASLLTARLERAFFLPR